MSFKQKDAKQILKNAVYANQPIAIFEAQERSISKLIQFSFSPIFVFLATPMIRLFKIGRILLIYFPLFIPFFVW